MNNANGKGVIAAGHPETARTAAIMLEEGGNAFDAVLAAVLTSAVVEPVLSSLGGGGFLLARPGDKIGGKPLMYDFFTQIPKKIKPKSELDFHPIEADFGTVTQEFHIGLASMATPGTVRGLFQVHRDLATMPLARIAEPAAALARKGFTVNRLQAYLFQVVGPIYMASAAARKIFADPENPERLIGEAETMHNPAYADILEVLTREGEDLFYRGEIAAAITRDCASGGGMLSIEDFESYRNELRKPLEIDYRGTRLYTNPAPSTGGILIAFALELLKELDVKAMGFGSQAHLETLARVMDLTNKARLESELHGKQDDGGPENILHPEFLATYKADILGRPSALRGTTHISVIDGDGNAASLTMSNGEGSGYMAPGTGIMINNMLGEEDINPLGFHQGPTDTRLCSMMAPSLAIGQDRMVALGSGGSNRLRTAILQVLLNLDDFAMPVLDAVCAPRIHCEGGLLSVEDGFDDAAIGKLQAAYPEIKRWQEKNLFFGGVHVACFNAGKGTFEGAGDPRRGGEALVV
ncbi:MAG: gamma-glutamyltransferase [Rhodospirillales bacterium]